ncbi:hypothetical protein OS493_040172, partial [Desmophyllum pertusum]
ANPRVHDVNQGVTDPPASMCGDSSIMIDGFEISPRDSADVYFGDAADALKSWAPPNFESGLSWVMLLVGYKATGEKPSWVRQASKKRYFGPASVAREGV